MSPHMSSMLLGVQLEADLIFINNLRQTRLAMCTSESSQSNGFRDLSSHAFAELPISDHCNNQCPCYTSDSSQGCIRGCECRSDNHFDQAFYNRLLPSSCCGLSIPANIVKEKRLYYLAI
ncbi:hypothetical protein TNCV_3326171 [Trichonephila clavipes]|nr:hypothetical protein TNCV_3326171 [Trichonephila clavipes]